MPVEEVEIRLRFGWMSCLSFGAKLQIRFFVCLTKNLTKNRRSDESQDAETLNPDTDEVDKIREPASFLLFFCFFDEELLFRDCARKFLLFSRSTAPQHRQFDKKTETFLETVVETVVETFLEALLDLENPFLKARVPTKRPAYPPSTKNLPRNPFLKLFLCNE